MADWADDAAEREQTLRDEALAAHRRRHRCPPAEGDDLVPCVCLVCDEPIPEARRRALPGVQTCIHCQAELEEAIQKGSRT